MGGISTFILALTAILIIVFTVDFFKFKIKLKDNIKYGIFFAAILILIDIITVVTSSEAFLRFKGIGALIGITLVFLRTVVCVSTGNYYCSILRINDMPLTRRLFNYWERRNTDSREEESLLDYSHKKEEFEEYYDEEIEYQPPIHIDWKKYVLWTLIALIGPIVYSIVLFKATSPEVSDIIKEMIQDSGGLMEVDTRTTFTICLLVFTMAFNEEIIFRLAMQNFFASRFKLQGQKYWIAITLTSLLWTLAHAGALKPEWVKFVQVFPIGIGLGYLFKRFGLESCIIAHGLVNVILTILNVQQFIQI